MTTIYATYQYYVDTYAGALVAEASFLDAARKASRLVDQLTYDRAGAIVADTTDLDTIDKIQMATCAVAEEVYKNDQSDGQDGIQSERVGNYSVAFAATSSKMRTFESKVSQAAALYLWATGLMFRGLNADER